MSIRLATMDEIPAIVSLLRDVAAEDRWIRAERPFDVSLRIQHLTAALNEGRVMSIVAGDRGAIVGELTVRLGAERAEIGMAIAASHRRRGIGRALMEAMIALVRGRSIRYVDLDVYAHNAAALALYRSLGFDTAERSPEIHVRASGERWETVPMTLDLRS